MTNLAFPPLPAHCRDDDDRAAKMTLLAGQINAANHRLLRLIAEFDRRKAWSGGGTVRSCAHWLNWQCGIALGAAREKVRVAHCLETLPQIDAAFAAGEVSCSKVRAMTRVATAGQDASYQGLRGSERCQVVLHVDIITLRERTAATACAHEHCHLDEKPWISTNTARRLACDASLDNLVTLCRYHHRQLHRGSFTLALEKKPAGSHGCYLPRHRENESKPPFFPSSPTSPRRRPRMRCNSRPRR